MTSDERDAIATLIGTGTSTGVPMINCDCATCNSSDPRDTRRRTSAVVRTKRGNILIDTTPDLKDQLRSHNIENCIAVLYTHHHFDHIGGFDDLRLLNFAQKKEIPIYGTAETLNAIRTMFAYAFDETPTDSSSPRIRPQEIAYGENFDVMGFKWTPLHLKHGRMAVTAFLSGDWAYCTDCKEIPGESKRAIRSVTNLVLDGLREREHPMHLSFDEAIDMANELETKRTWLTHIAHDQTHREIMKRTPANIEPGFDGLSIPIRLAQTEN